MSNDPLCLDAQTLLALADDFEEGPTVSLFTPWGRGDARRANEIRTKRLASLAAERWPSWADSNGRLSAVQEAIEKQLSEIEAGADHDAVALFTDGVRTRRWSLPLDRQGPPREGFYVEQRPFVRPLLPLVERERRFLVLLLSLEEPQLFVGSQLGFEEAPTELPSSLESVVGGEVESRGVQHHSQRPVQGTQTMYHGHGGGHDDTTPELLRFLREIDDRIVNDWASKDLPLILAGVERERGHFLKITRYRSVLEEGVTFDRSHQKPEALHQKALEVLADREEERRRGAIERLRGHLEGSSDAVVADLSRLFIDSYAGQVGELFLLDDVEIWGSFDPKTGKLSSAQDRHDSEAREELLNRLVLTTWSRAGAVHAIAKDEAPASWPGGAGAVGLLRAPLRR